MNAIIKCLVLPMVLGAFLFAGTAQAGKPLTYFLPNETFNPAIPTPEGFLGFEIGEWHLQHHPLHQYFQQLAAVSDRAIIYEYGRSHQQRPLVQLIITSPANHARLEEIRKNHLLLADPARSAGIDISRMPVVVKLLYGVHGNEPSTHNASPLVAYYLLASESAEVKAMLDNMVIIIDPSLNPDGQDRFASWVNRHRSLTLNPDPEGREFHDVWPGSRTNHYWFDLNRDWLLLQHPESASRVRAYHRWLPNVSGDFHEFGPNETYFFHPGVPSRINPLTPDRTNELTLAIAKYHARAMDEKGHLYYMFEDFDDFYPGKGSTYTDLAGSIGILFEQATTRGHRRETIHGVVDFHETILNQVTISFSTLRGAYSLRAELLEHMRQFFRTGIEEAGRLPVKAYVFGDAADPARNNHFLRVLLDHQIAVNNLKEPVTIEGQTFEPGSAWMVSIGQPHSRLVRTLFEKPTTFEDSIFYDVSAWNFPLAFNLPFKPVVSPRQATALQGERLMEIPVQLGKVSGGMSLIGYVFDWKHYYAPKVLYFLQKNNIRTRVATEPFAMNVAETNMNFGFGSIFVPTQIQDIESGSLYALMLEAAQLAGVEIFAATTSFTTAGINLGSGGFAALDKPEILLLAGPGVDSREAGEIWHLLDYRYRIPVTIVEPERFGNIDLERYNTIVMPSGGYGGLTKENIELLNRWLQNGGTLVALGNANNWLQRNDVVQMEFVKTPEIDDPSTLPYVERSRLMGSRRISGSIFRSEIDITHPIGFGYRSNQLPVFVSGTGFAKPAASPFANPLMFSKESLLSGYVYAPFLPMVENSSGIVINRKGGGNIVSFMFNPNFRGVWFGTNRLFMNALFFGEIIRR
ncbi:MAG TPA: M14 family metallopeptidase [Bacteroidales bacterium]|nr:M14 family metallopeptidase [Bacteroidales bacterium]